MTDALVIPDNPYIRPSKAAHLLNIPVRRVYLLQAQGKLTDVVTTPGNHRRYSVHEVLSLRGGVQGSADHG